MTLIRLVEEGPTDKWFKSLAPSRIYRLHYIQAAAPYYRLDILRRNTRVFTEEQSSSKDDRDAKIWARITFLDFLLKERIVPCGDCLE